MFGSKNCTFNKSEELLKVTKSKIKQLLKLKGRSSKDIEEYLKAFDFFVYNPNQFDGATIVKDLNDLPNLDIDAMLHDYLYLQGANLNFVKKWQADLKYIKNMEKQGKGIRVARLLLLTISGLFFVPYCNLKKLIK